MEREPEKQEPEQTTPLQEEEVTSATNPHQHQQQQDEDKEPQYSSQPDESVSSISSMDATDASRRTITTTDSSHQSKQQQDMSENELIAEQALALEKSAVANHKRNRQNQHQNQRPPLQYTRREVVRMSQSHVWQKSSIAPQIQPPGYESQHSMSSTNAPTVISRRNTTGEVSYDGSATTELMRNTQISVNSANTRISAGVSVNAVQDVSGAVQPGAFSVAGVNMMENVNVTGSFSTSNSGGNGSSNNSDHRSMRNFSRYGQEHDLNANVGIPASNLSSNDSDENCDSQQHEDYLRSSTSGSMGDNGLRRSNNRLSSVFGSIRRVIRSVTNDSTDGRNRVNYQINPMIDQQSIITSSRIRIETSCPTVASLETRFVPGTEGLPVAEPVDEEEEKRRMRREIEEEVRRELQEQSDLERGGGSDVVGSSGLSQLRSSRSRDLDNCSDLSQSVMIVEKSKMRLQKYVTALLLIIAIGMTVYFATRRNGHFSHQNNAQRWNLVLSVYRDNYTNYSNKGRKSLFGHSVAVGTLRSTGENIIVVSSPGLNEGMGGVFSYRWNSSSYYPGISPLDYGPVLNGGDGLDGESSHGFGHSVSLSRDGKHLAVGCVNYHTPLDIVDQHLGSSKNCSHYADVRVKSSSVEIFDFDTAVDGWVRHDLPLTGENYGNNSYTDGFGSVVTMSNPESGPGFLVIGSPMYSIEEDGKITSENIGRVSIFKNMGKKWISIDHIIGLESDSYFGASASISGDGNILAIGAVRPVRYPCAFDIDLADGKVFIYRFDKVKEKFILAQNIISEDSSDFFGRSVSLSEDGLRLGIGAFMNDGEVNDSGHVRMYKMGNSGKWIQDGGDIDGEKGRDYSGWAVSLSGSGDSVAIGSPMNDFDGDGSGQVYVYDVLQNSGKVSWETEKGEIVGRSNENFGFDVALTKNANLLAVGSVHGEILSIYERNSEVM